MFAVQNTIDALALPASKRLGEHESLGEQSSGLFLCALLQSLLLLAYRHETQRLHSPRPGNGDGTSVELRFILEK